MTRDEPPGLEVTVRLVDLDVFKGMVRLVTDVYAMSDENVKERIESEMRRLLKQDEVTRAEQACRNECSCPWLRLPYMARFRR